MTGRIIAAFLLFGYALGVGCYLIYTHFRPRE
jgi:hypothetical protein